MTYRISANIRGLIFDFDGTIVDSMPIHYLSWREAFATCHADFSEDFFYRHAGVSLVKVVEHYNAEHGTFLSPEAVVRLKDDAHAKYLPQTTLIPPVMQIIEAYHGKLPMAVATGNSKNLTAPLLERLALEKFFDAVVYGDDVHHPKPHPECFLKAASLIDVPASACEVFEDGEAGLEGARRAGMKATDIRPWLEK